MRLQRVHRLHKALDHRKQQGPAVVARFEVSHKRFSDQGIFLLAFEQGLIGNLVKKRDGRPDPAGHLDSEEHVLFAPRASLVPQEHRRLGFRSGGNIHMQVMFPDQVMPLLRDQSQLVHLPERRFQPVGDFPFELRLRPGDVLRQSGRNGRGSSLTPGEVGPSPDQHPQQAQGQPRHAQRTTGELCEKHRITSQNHETVQRVPLD